VRRLAPALERRFGPEYREVGMFPIPILTRDVPKYKITPHTDTKWKGITVQFYLPPDDTTNDIGTIFTRSCRTAVCRRPRRCRSRRTAATPSRVGSDSWHSADPVGPHVKTRDSILHTYFVDQGLLRVIRNRGRRVAISSATKSAAGCASARGSLGQRQEPGQR